MPVEIGHILCPTDFSANAQHALELSVVLAKRLRSRITVLHAVPRLSVAPVRGTLALAPTAWPAETSGLVADLEWFCEPARGAGVRADAALCTGEATQQILEYARALEADLVVMGTRGARAAGGWRMGSVTARVIGRASCPVLSVPEPPRSARRIDEIRRILCPMDFSEPGALGLEYARSLARAFRARLLLLHVLEWFPDESPLVDSYCVGEFQLDLASEARLRMEDLARVHACEHEEYVSTGLPHVKVLRLAQERKVDLIVLGVHGRREIDRLLPGSTVTHVLRQAHCPVLAVCPPAPGKQVEPHEAGFD
jgi:nucleotide-binding universal stress UspA family protein